MEGTGNGVTGVLSGKEWELLELWRQLTAPQQEAIGAYIQLLIVRAATCSS